MTRGMKMGLRMAVTTGQSSELAVFSACFVMQAIGQAIGRQPAAGLL